MKYTLRQLEIFLAIAREQNISRAAEKLYMSQSAASAALQNLEQSYDVALFERMGKRLKLSNVGQTLRTKAESLVAHAREFERDLEGHDEIGHLSIGASMTIGNYLAVDYLPDYIAQHPEAKIDFQVASTPEVVARLLNFELDLAMIEGEVRHSDLEIVPWREDRLVIFCSPTHPLAKKKALRKKDMLRERWILREPDSGTRKTFDRALRGLTPKLNVFLELRHNEAIKHAVEAGIGIGCLSEIVLEKSFQKGELVPLHLPRVDMRRTLFFALPKYRYRNSAVEWWLEVCKRS